MSRLAVTKTAKLFVGGAFVRSESGRVDAVSTHDGRHLANVARASRKDARDAVVAARSAVPGWSGTTAYNRGQVLYRVAEMLESRHAEFAAAVAAAEGLEDRAAEGQVDAAVDRWVWYAGWADKVAQVVGSSNPVAGPYFNFTVPEPTGVVATIAPAEPSLLALAAVVAPAVVTGNAVVVVVSPRRPWPAVLLSEVIATSDVPPGVVNVLTGDPAELGPPLAGHGDVNALDLAGADAQLAAELAGLAAGTTKRVLPCVTSEVWQNPPTPGRMVSLIELKTVWHPVGP